jgi:hypothetical protein
MPSNELEAEGAAGRHLVATATTANAKRGRWP